MRISFLRVLVVLGVIGGIVFAGLNMGRDAVAAAVAETRVPSPTAFAGYVDVTALPIHHFEIPTGPAHHNVILAFVVADKAQACTPSWGTYYTLDEADTSLDLNRRIAQLRASEGDIRVSFGGAINDELSTVCSDPAALVAAYSAVVDHYALTSIDLDIEGSAAAAPDVAARRATALKALQDRAVKQGSHLAVWLTLPVSTQGLTPEGVSEVTAMLAAGVDLAGVNGMAMDFGSSKDAGASMASATQQAAEELHRQLGVAYEAAGQGLDTLSMWTKVGITPMIGQNDVTDEKFTLQDATAVNQFALANHLGLVSMWSMNRDATCSLPLPVTSSVVHDTCSGVDQAGKSFHDALSAGSTDGPVTTAEAVTAPSPSATPTRSIVDDPATSPFPIWDATGDYPAGTRIVWKRNVYTAKWWTHGTAPDSPVTNPADAPWRLIGPVLPGDHPAPLPTLPAGTYPTWDSTAIYNQGARVQIGLVPYESKWWNQGDQPGLVTGDAGPWKMIFPIVTDLG